MPTRKDIRLKDWDYSQNGAYFVTFCTQNRNCILSQFRRGDPCGRPVLTEIGKICDNTIKIIENQFNVQVTNYVIMPNHIHVLLLLENQATARVAPTVGSIIGGYKSLVANDWLKICKAQNRCMGTIWQRGYYDNIVRDANDYETRWHYINGNPSNWQEDEYYNP